MTVAIAQRIKLRLFVEGVEIPCISCQVQAQPNSPMMASIQIPPLSEATRFLPRSLIHVFFWDMYAQETDDTYSRSGSSVQKDQQPRVSDLSHQQAVDTIGEDETTPRTR